MVHLRGRTEDIKKDRRVGVGGDTNMGDVGACHKEGAGAECSVVRWLEEI